jgi:PGF-CTERM protein
LSKSTQARQSPSYTVANLLNEKQTIAWSISGSKSEWATLVPDETLVPCAGQGRVVVAASPPEEARNGEVAELLLLGTSKQDTGRQVFVRLTAYVNTRDDISDESHLAQEIAEDVKKQNDSLKKDSPGFEIAAVVAGLLAIGVMLLRRE